MKKKDYYVPPFERFQPEISKVQLKKEILSGVGSEVFLEDICHKREYSMEELLIIKIILAEHAFLACDYSLGERLLREVEASKEKTKTVSYYLQEIQKNKKLYIRKSKQEKNLIKVKIKKVE